MQALEAAGDRAGALRHASAHSELLRTELDAAPEREVRGAGRKAETGIARHPGCRRRTDRIEPARAD